MSGTTIADFNAFCATKTQEEWGELARQRLAGFNALLLQLAVLENMRPEGERRRYIDLGCFVLDLEGPTP